MAMISFSFVAGVLTVFYLSTLFCFAVLRIFTGVSIQRIGFAGLRRIKFSPRDGIRLEIRGLSVQIHRPTFAQPTWASLVVTELRLSADIAKLRRPHFKTDAHAQHDPKLNVPNGVSGDDVGASPASVSRGIWTQLSAAKDQIKRLQSKISWLRLVDIVANRTSVVIVGVGAFEVGSFGLQVDTRKTTVDRSRLFHHTPRQKEQLPAEWTLVFRTISFVPVGQEPEELLDHGVLNIHGFLNPKVAGLRDASLSIKVGRLNLPYDILHDAMARTKAQQSSSLSIRKSALDPVLNSQSTPQEALLAILEDAKDFLSSMIHGIRDISVLVAFVGTSMRVEYVRPAGKPLYLNMSMREIGLDIYRLDPSTPAHSMYFSRNDVAHQALLSALAFSLGIDDAHSHPERLVYVPMTTATLRTTFPGKLIEYAEKKGNLELNTNVLLANLVITSPSIDLDPAHLPILLAVPMNRKRSPTTKPKRPFGAAYQLLPKLSTKLLIHEPVVRIAIPPIHDVGGPDSFDFDLVISAISSISIDIDASHSATEQRRYAVLTSMRVISHRLYYQTRLKHTQDLMVLESLELKSQVTSAPAISVTISGSMHTLSCFMVRPEMSEALRKILMQLRSDVVSEKIGHSKSSHSANTIRALPVWLEHVELQAHELMFEMAGVDKKLSPMSRGVALHLESWSIDYKAHKDERTPKRPTTTRRRNRSQSVLLEDEMQRTALPKNSTDTPVTPSSDGRRVTVHLKTFEAFVIEDMDVWEVKPFLSVPRAEVALTTLHDSHGPISHVNCYVKAVYLEYSLFRHYAWGVAISVLHQLTNRRLKDIPKGPSPRVMVDPELTSKDSKVDFAKVDEYLALDVRLPFFQVKAQLPADPAMMFHLEGLEVGRHRFAHPHAHGTHARLYAQSPTVKKAWSRVISVKAPRVDLRTMNRVHKGVTTMENSIDFASDAIRVGIPHQLIVHHLFDNIANTLKAVKQLHHRFISDSDEYILAKEPEGAKRVPRVTIRTHVFLFEIEDGPFEWKLGCIYRTGLIEQKQRLAREEAFKLKAEKIANAKHGPQPDPAYKGSPRRSQDRGRNYSPDARARSPIRTQSSHNSGDRTGRSPPRNSRPSYGLRYDKRGTCDITSEARTSTDRAWEKLQNYNAQSWKKRIDSAIEFQTTAVRDVRTLLWGIDSSNHEGYHGETILKLPQRPALMQILMSDLHMTIDKPSFPSSHLPDFMHDVGKGLPKNTKYSLLVPMNWNFEMGETRMALRDYPLPLLHIPAIQPGQSPRLPAWSLKTDFVIAEEFRDYKSTKDLNVIVIPPEKMGSDKHSRGFAIDVRRTVSPVKTYSDMKIEVNTSRDSRFSWGASYQAAIQDMMQVIEGFSKPQLDPSERVGFWDKIRLSFHSRVSASWKGDGDVHLVLKGTRDPYVVVDHGAGLIMIWRNGVQWNIGQNPDPRAFMTVDAGDFVLAIPDFSHYARAAPDMAVAEASEHAITSFQHELKLKKVVMKLSGKVRWQVGMVFERDLENGRRSFDFIPHYDVTLQNPVHIKTLGSQDTYDAFAGFRSNHIHMSIAVVAPSDREWSLSNPTTSKNYNSVHLTPRFFTHFYAWWSMFSGAMSLPVHQGPLFPGSSASGKKFGRHLATLKYSLLLAPLYVSHVYKHKDADEWAEDVVSATGLKVRLDSFMLDLHMRREEFTSEVKGLNKVVKTSGMRINQTLLDLSGADIRAVSASLVGTSTDSVRHATNEEIKTYAETPQVVNLSDIHIPDDDYSWIDADDFVEISWTLPVTRAPRTEILPLAYAPRFTYRRQTDHADNIHGDKDRHSPFGNEHTHDCIMSSGNDPRQVQIGLIKERLDNIDKLLELHRHSMDDQELEAVKEADVRHLEREKLEELRENGIILNNKKTFLRRMLHELQQKMESAPLKPSDSHDTGPRTKHNPSHESHNGYSAHFGNDIDPQGIDLSSLPDYVSDFNNRFVVHNAQIKWNNSLRNIMLRYIHQVSQRRGFVYYTSRRAVKFILDIIDDQQKAKQKTDSPVKDAQPAEGRQSATVDDDEELDIQARINELLSDANKFVDAEDTDAANGNRKQSTAEIAENDVSHHFMAQNSYHVRLIAPQIQLQSEKNTKAVVLVTARGMRLKVLQIMDKDRIHDDVSGLVQTRFAAEMDNMQFFATTKKSLSAQFLKLFAGHHYGAAAGSAWPPWAPIEAMFDFSVQTYGFQRVVQRTSASLRYDKYNNLRLKYNDSVHSNDPKRPDGTVDAESRMDHLWVDFPHLRAICDSTQYYAIYVIILDLLMWSEPLEKTRHERLEKIMLASDFSDLTGAPELVTKLQHRIRNLNEIKTHFHVHESQMDRQGWQDRIALEQDLAGCEEELFFIMKAITTAQQKVEERVEGAANAGIMKWFLSASEIVWHLTKDADKPLAEFQLNHATYERIDNSDGSNLNVVEIDRLYGVSLLPNSIYPEIIAAHSNHPDGQLSAEKMLQIRWLKLEAIAGINVVDHFEVNLHPLRIQLEYETGKQLFGYVFPGMDGTDDSASPLLVRNKLPSPEDIIDEQEVDDANRARNRAASIEKANTDFDSMPGMATGAGLLQYRLQPTFKLPDRQKMASTSSLPKTKPSNKHLEVGNSHRSVFSRMNGSMTSLKDAKPRPAPQASMDNLSITSRGRASSTFSGTSVPHAKEHGLLKRFGIGKSSRRSESSDSRAEIRKDSKLELAKKDKKDKDLKNKDDLTQMLNRASNYMTLAYVKIPSVVLCLSYKGKGHRNFEDVHSLVFRMPTLEYRNKTWSNLDLALSLKKDVIRALISHTGAIIGNKIMHHKPGKNQVNRLQELARSSVVMSSNEIARVNSSAANSILPDDIDEEYYSELGDRNDHLFQTRSITSTDASESLDGYGERPRLASHLSSLTTKTRDSTNPAEAVKDKVMQGLSAVAHIGRRRDTITSERSLDRPKTSDRDDTEDGSGTLRRGGGILRKKLLGALDRA